MCYVQKDIHKSLILDSLARSISLNSRIEILKSGTDLYKIRDKGMRGINVYKRYIRSFILLIQGSLPKKTGYLMTSIKKVGGFLAKITISLSLKMSLR